MYTMDVQADGGIISISIPENVTEDVSGNGNLPSNILQLRHCKGFHLFSDQCIHFF